MTNRFVKKRRSFSGTVTSALLPILSVVLCLVMLVLAAEKLDATAEKSRLSSIENAIRQSAVHCYATTGAYPESLDYLKQHYGITYDENKYAVYYSAFASNIMPEITVISY